MGGRWRGGKWDRHGDGAGSTRSLSASKKTFEEVAHFSRVQWYNGKAMAIKWGVFSCQGSIIFTCICLVSRTLPMIWINYNGRTRRGLPVVMNSASHEMVSVTMWLIPNWQFAQRSVQASDIIAFDFSRAILLPSRLAIQNPDRLLSGICHASVTANFWDSKCLKIAASWASLPKNTMAAQASYWPAFLISPVFIIGVASAPGSVTGEVDVPGSVLHYSKIWERRN